MKTPLLSFLLIIAGWGCWAQTLSDSLATLELAEVVVTGQFEPQSARNSVYQIRTIAMEKMQARGAVRLQDVLNTELNIRFSQDMALGGSNLTMQGLAGQNVKVLIDGMPMVGRQGTSNEININQINVNSIERIEIVEGPMSVMYGADALAGVINIITRKTNDGKLDVAARVHEETVGKEYGWKEGIHNQSVSAGYSWNKYYVRGDVSRNDHGGWTGDMTGREKQWHPKNQVLMSGTTGINTEKWNAYYRADYLYEKITNPGNYGNSGNPTEALDQDYNTNRLMHQVQAIYNPKTWWDVNTAISYTNYKRETVSSTVNRNTGERRLALGAGLQDNTRFNGFSARTTWQLKVHKKFSLQPGFDINRENGEGGRIQEGVQSIGDYAVFVSGEWKVTEWLQLRPGLRTIYNSIYQAPPAVPSLNAKLTLHPCHDLRASYGRGFRAPSLRELYFNFFDASHSIEGNQNLEAELSHSFNGSWTWKVSDKGASRFSMVTGAFYNTVSNMIGFGQKPGNSVVTTYLNIDKFKTKGITWNNKWQRGTLEANVGLAYTGRYNELAEAANNADEFNWSPEVTTSLTYTIEKVGLLFSAYHKYTGRTPFYELTTVDGGQVATLAEIEDYHWLDVTVKKNLGAAFAVSAGCRNLLNVTNINSSSLATGGVHSGGSTRPIGNGRSYFINITYSLLKL
ncbi:MAG: TonB-dependent receptor plug domain-containing protein [Bacteroidota bacterium]